MTDGAIEDPLGPAVPGTTAPDDSVPTDTRSDNRAGTAADHAGTPPGDDAPVTGAAARSRRGVVVAGLMLALALVALDATIVATAVPSIVGQLGGFSLFAWVFSAYLLAQTVTVPVYGRLSDIYGRKPILLVGVVIFVAGSVLAGAAWNMLALIAFRGLQGLGAGAVLSTANTVAGDLYSVRERGRIQGWLSSVWGMSAVLGPTLGGLLSEYASWRWIFYLNLPVGAACLWVLSRYLHENVVSRRARIDVTGGALLVGGVSLTILALMMGGVQWAWLSPPGVTVAVAAALLLVVFALHERRTAAPMIPPWLFRDRALLGVNAATVVFGMAVIGLSAYLPTYAQGVLGAGAVTAGLALAAMSIGWPLSSSLSSRLYLRIGFRDTACIGALVCVGAALLLVLLPQHVPLWVAAVGSLFMGAGLGLVSTPVIVGVQSLVDWGQRGVATASNMSMRYLGQSVGAAVFAGIANSTLVGRLDAAPQSIRGELPTDVDQVSQALDGAQPGPTTSYLRQALYDATHHVFVALLVVAALLLVVLLTATPRRFGHRD